MIYIVKLQSAALCMQNREKVTVCTTCMLIENKCPVTLNHALFFKTQVNGILAACCSVCLQHQCGT